MGHNSFRGQMTLSQRSPRTIGKHKYLHYVCNSKITIMKWLMKIILWPGRGGSYHTWGTIVKDCSIKKVENHCSMGNWNVKYTGLVLRKKGLNFCSKGWWWMWLIVWSPLCYLCGQDHIWSSPRLNGWGLGITKTSVYKGTLFNSSLFSSWI